MASLVSDPMLGPIATADAGAGDSPALLPVSLLGIPFDPLTIEATVGRVGAMIASGRPHFLVTANVDFLVKARRDAELRQAFFLADHVLCDGTPLIWASRWLGNALPGRTAGSDLVPALLRRGEDQGWKFFLLGAAEGAAEEAARRIAAEHPKLPPVAFYSPPFKPLREMNHEEILERIRAARPDILLVAFGCPKQEKWIAMHYRTLGVPVSIGVGATVDFLAGRVLRAPVWMQRSGTEWLFRLLQEPRRLFGRYLDDFVHFLPDLFRQHRHFAGRSGARGDAASPPRCETTHYGLRVHVGPRLDRALLQRTLLVWERAVDQRGHCLVDLSEVRHIDSTGLAFLGTWQKRLAAVRRNLVLYRPSAAVKDTMQRMDVTSQFVITEGP